MLIFYDYKQKKTLPDKMLIKKIVKKINTIAIGKIKKCGILMKEPYVSDKSFLNASISLYNSIDKLLNHFNEREKPIFFINENERGKIVEIVGELDTNIIKNTIKEADKFCNHIFDLLGSGPVKLIVHNSLRVDRGKKLLSTSYQPIDWHIDFKSGTKWNFQIYYREIKMQREADRKVPRELSRFHHLATLGKSYWYVNYNKYAREFVSEITDWIESNPPEFGINWQVTMDVAIRACNLILGFSFFKDSREITNEFLLKFLKSLYQHSRHIMANLERGKIATNHYLSDIVGLVYIGVMFPEFKQAKKWREFGIKELIKEMKNQIYSDGVDFEASTCYHRLVLELFFFSTLLVVINDNNFDGVNYREITEKIFGGDYTERLYRMFEFILYVLKPNGKMPQIGDNDSGRLHIFANREVLDMRYLLTLGAIFFEEPRFKIKEFGFCEEGLWVFGKKGYDKWKRLLPTCLDEIKSKYFKESGIYVIRHKRDYIIISNCPNGQNGKGGHNHNDKLSFELSVEGQDIIVDPGTYVYTPDPEWRNKFRSTKYHNTIEVDGKEQNILGDNLFRMEGNSNVYLNEIKESKEVVDITLSHDGYKRLEGCVLHSRRFIYNKINRFLRIEDKVSGKGEHIISFNLHFSNEIKIKKTDIKTFTIFHHKLSTPLCIEVNGFKNVFIEEGYISSEYGKKEKAEVLCGSIKTELPFESELVIYIDNKNNVGGIK